MENSYFSTPITRKQYWIRVIIASVGISIIAGIIGAATGATNTMSIIGSIILLIYSVIIQIKRLKDANKSYLFILLDLIGLWVGVIVIGCFPSENRQY